MIKELDTIYIYIVCPECTHIFNTNNTNKKISYFQQWYLIPLQGTPLGISFRPASLPLLKVFYKILFWNCHQLTVHILLNLVYGVSIVILALGKSKSCSKPNLAC